MGGAPLLRSESLTALILCSTQTISKIFKTQTPTHPLPYKAPKPFKTKTHKNFYKNLTSFPFFDKLQAVYQISKFPQAPPKIP